VPEGDRLVPTKAQPTTTAKANIMAGPAEFFISEGVLAFGRIASRTTWLRSPTRGLCPYCRHSLCIFSYLFVFLEEMNTLQVAILFVLPMPIPHGGRDGEVQQ
jgi:hypothetical protein